MKIFDKGSIMNNYKKEIIALIIFSFIIVICWSMGNGIEKTLVINGRVKNYNSSAIPIVEQGKAYTITPPSGVTPSSTRKLSNIII